MDEQNLQNSPYSQWLEGAVKTIFEGKPVSIGLVAHMENDEVLTAYYKANMTEKAIFAAHINEDITLEIIKNNAGLIFDWMQDIANGDEPQEDGYADDCPDEE